jgi:hypothetical protein
MRDAFWSFSLRRLMVGVTVLCVLCALIANFPEAAIALALTIPFLVPTVVVCAGLPLLSSRPFSVFVATMIGAFVGRLLTPPAIAEWSNLYSFELLSPTWLPADGAFVLGFAWVMFFPRWKEPRG